MAEDVNAIMQQAEADPGIGLDMGHIVPVVSDVKGKFEVGEIVTLENLKNVDVSLNESVVSDNYDNETKVTAISKGAKEIKITKDRITKQDEVMLFGAVEQDGQMFGNEKQDKRPLNAFGYRRETTNGYRLVWIFKTRAAQGNESEKTREQSLSFNNAELTLTAQNRNADGEWRTWKDVTKDEWTEDIGTTWFSKGTVEKLIADPAAGGGSETPTEPAV